MFVLAIYFDANRNGTAFLDPAFLCGADMQASKHEFSPLGNVLLGTV